MRVEGLVWETSRAEVQVFLYASETERKRDTDLLDTVFVAPRGTRVHWRWPATLVTSGNLAAIILSLNDRQSERIGLALALAARLADRARQSLFQRLSCSRRCGLLARSGRPGQFPARHLPRLVVARGSSPAWAQPDQRLVTTTSQAGRRTVARSSSRCAERPMDLPSDPS
jgi:hypothetical protein